MRKIKVIRHPYDGMVRYVRVVVDENRGYTFTYYSGLGFPKWAEIIPVKGRAGEEIIELDNGKYRQLLLSIRRSAKKRKEKTPWDVVKEEMEKVIAWVDEELRKLDN